MVPFRLAKMKRADVPFTRKDEVSVLATWPVGPWAGPLPDVGIPILPSVPIGDTFMRVGVTWYRVDVLVPWFETQMGLVAV